MTQFKYATFVVPSRSKDAPADYEDRWEKTFGAKCKECDAKPHKLSCSKNESPQLELSIVVEAEEDAQALAEARRVLAELNADTSELATLDEVLKRVPTNE